MRKKIAFFVICTIITLFLAELSFQFIHANADKKFIRKTFLKRLLYYTEPPFSWEKYFLNNLEKGDKGYVPILKNDTIHHSHKTRGWGLKPNVSAVIKGNVYTTNSHGYRSLSEFNYDPTKYGVLIVGDSFTFGDDIDDSITWPHLLQQLDKQLNIFNLGGSGYGVDQMYITLSETISQYRPKLIIAAFIDNDLHRSLLDFRDYKKPRFVIKNDKLVMTNTPIGNIEEIINDISQKKIDNYSSVQIINVINAICRKLKLTSYIEEPKRSDRYGGCGSECTKLNEKLFEKMAEIAKQNNADFLMVYLPYGEEIFDREFQGYGNYFFDNYKMGHKNFFLNPREELADLKSKSYVHYKEPANKVVSRRVYKKIQELPSWKDFQTN
jgi:hypothetical protein